MDDERTGLEMDQQIFAAARDVADSLIADLRFEPCRYGPAQAAIADDHIRDSRTCERGCDAPPRGFYFGKFGQRRPKLFDLRFFVFDVLADYGVEFLRLELVRMQALVLGGRVVMTGAGGRNQFDLVAHVGPLRP